MARYGMVFDLKRCIGCNACVIGCKQENSLPDGVFFTRTLSEEYGVYPAVNRVYIPTLCNHCEDAPCEKVCPSGATYTRPDGIVMVDPQKCIGCGSCAVACPYDQRSEMKAEAFKDGLVRYRRRSPTSKSRVIPATRRAWSPSAISAADAWMPVSIRPVW
jgi:Fe-S-cluster-containing dehydrogenase component